MEDFRNAAMTLGLIMPYDYLYDLVVTAGNTVIVY